MGSDCKIKKGTAICGAFLFYHNPVNQRHQLTPIIEKGFLIIVYHKPPKIVKEMFPTKKVEFIPSRTK